MAEKTTVTEEDRVDVSFNVKGKARGVDGSKFGARFELNVEYDAMRESNFARMEAEMVKHFGAMGAGVTALGQPKK